MFWWFREKALWKLWIFRNYFPVNQEYCMEILACHFHSKESLSVRSTFSTFPEAFLPSAKSLILIRLLETYQLPCWKIHISQQWRKIMSFQDWSQGGWNQAKKQTSTKCFSRCNHTKHTLAFYSGGIYCLKKTMTKRLFFKLRWLS